MIVSLQNGAMKKFCRTPWRFQQTFRTPSQALPSFVAAILDSVGPAPLGVVTIDAVAMQPIKLEALLSQHQSSHDIRRDITIEVESASELPHLLTAAFGDWVDFLFVPSPRQFVIYADHDEYATFFASSKAGLSKVASALTTQGFTSVEHFSRST